MNVMDTSYCGAIVVNRDPACTSSERYREWLPFLDTYRTMCRNPEPTFRQILEDVRELRFAAYWRPQGPAVAGCRPLNYAPGSARWPHSD